MRWPARKAVFTAHLGVLALSSALLTSQVQAAGTCTLGRVAEIPITMAGTRPLINAKINNQEARFVLDSGAFYSMISTATAAEFNLKLTPGPYGLKLQGIGGTVTAQIATVKEFGIAGALIHNVEFLVGGSEVGSEGLIGQNFLHQWDVEYDFSKGVVRLFKPEGCRKARMAYWLTPGQTYSETGIESVMQSRMHTVGEGYVNGQHIRVTFDTGAYNSFLSLRAAARAGIKIDSPGVVEAGYSRGIGRGMVKTYIATASSFKIGDGEEIKNARLRIADSDLAESDMLLGSDFFVSHHIFVANSQSKLYLSYNGGPVFNLAKTTPATTPQADEVQKVEAAKDEAPGDQQGGAAAADQQADPDALARRGEASAARHDFEHALADLSKAVELRPDNPEYLFQRALIYRQSGQAALALADLDHVLTLNQDFLRAYLPRAEIRLGDKNVEGAIADLDATDRLAPKQADLRFALAERYEAVNRFAQAIAQYDLWIQNHPVDSRFAAALGQRCRASAIQNEALDVGLADCNKALRIADKKNPSYGHLLENRGLLELRQANNDKAIADFDAALKIMPKSATALYGRGVAKVRKNKTAEGEADMAEAVKIAPHIAAPFSARGLAP
ncbi:MAG TPA: aspartyl protease family protein [Steroidobacteraceae bacterium]|nr:aspartyl protease family protein [Steroidobacteraceae bacterium]